MGMDVYGREPSTPEGEYFRRNVWGWHPLWDLVEDLFPELASGVESPHTNDGDGLAAVEAAELGHSLKIALNSGAVERWLWGREVLLERIPNRPCPRCEGSADDPYDPTGCTVCVGTGEVKPFERNYSTDAESVDQFATFLIGSGGFNIL